MYAHTNTLKSHSDEILQYPRDNSTSVSQWGGPKTLGHHGSSTASTSTTPPNARDLQSKPSALKSSKRHWGKTDDDEHSEGDEDDSPKQPRKLKTPEMKKDLNLRFACPYRKRDPQKYNVRDWRSCAISAHETVARVKSHLYTKHSINQCDRCKVTYATEEELDDHGKAVQGCIMVEGPIDGVTREMKRQLQSRKKRFRGQTEAQSWEQLYCILFPHDPLPNSPYFNPIKDENFGTVQSQDFRCLADLEAFLGPELERLFRQEIETERRVDTLITLEDFIPRMLRMLRNVRQTAFENFRNTLNASVSNSELAPLADSWEDPSNIPIQNSGSMLYQVPSPREYDSTLPDIQCEKTADRQDGSLDSGYGSCLMDADLSFIDSSSSTSITTRALLSDTSQHLGHEKIVEPTSGDLNDNGVRPKPIEEVDQYFNKMDSHHYTFPNLIDIDAYAGRGDQFTDEIEFPHHSFPDLVDLDDIDWPAFSQQPGGLDESKSKNQESAFRPNNNNTVAK